MQLCMLGQTARRQLMASQTAVRPVRRVATVHDYQLLRLNMYSRCNVLATRLRQGIAVAGAVTLLRRPAIERRVASRRAAV